MTLWHSDADLEERPVKNEEGKWDALDSFGYGHVLGFDSSEEVVIWLDGYKAGARENM